ncbi:heat shock protein DnaJ with tetratricopeptide repeat-containing protein [Actinidia rufa]|uniref:Heat shock protein DnaJ with tetratricopeptide repeat-containing protein n=1 Tax=Actinidia rufa TaxID=165716 RepID=A0A7J0EZY1_9ERIC|nr:heat shock protein DnaJ with tetratricopeptide repeat-containing protein [Actinidia rufa]
MDCNKEEAIRAKESAFKLIGEAHMVLSDQGKRSLYDNKCRVSMRKTATKPPPPQFNQNPSDRKQNMSTQPQPSSTSGRQTFWTSCPFCNMRYQYYRDFVNRALRCQKCVKPFIAYDLGAYGVPPGSNFDKPAFPQQNQSQSQGFCKVGSQSTGGFPPPQMRSQGSFNSKTVQSEPVSRTGTNAEVDGGSMTKDKDWCDKGGGKERVGSANVDAVKPKESGTSRNTMRKRRRKLVVESSESCDTATSADTEDDVIIPENSGDSAGGNSGLNDVHPRRSFRKRRHVSYNESLGGDDNIVNHLKRSRGNGSVGDSKEELKGENVNNGVSKAENSSGFTADKEDTQRKRNSHLERSFLNKSGKDAEHDVTEVEGDMAGHDAKTCEVIDDTESDSNSTCAPDSVFYECPDPESPEKGVKAMSSAEKLNIPDKCVSFEGKNDPEKETFILRRSPRKLDNKDKKQNQMNASQCPTQGGIDKDLDSGKNEKCVDFTPSKGSSPSSCGDEKIKLPMKNASPQNREKIPNISQSFSLGGKILEVFHNFNGDKSEGKFKLHQIWALYNEDGLPKNYAQVKKIKSDPFILHVDMLEECTISKDRAQTVCCGTFKLQTGKARVFSPSSFSHLVRPECIGKNEFKIFPRVGEVWALYKDWNADASCSDLKKGKYQIVEVFEENGNCMKVSFLIQLNGFKSVFKTPRRHRSSSVMEIPLVELARFSHQIPSFKLTEEKNGLLRGCWELDPAAIPVPVKQLKNAGCNIKSAAALFYLKFSMDSCYHPVKSATVSLCLHIVISAGYFLWLQLASGYANKPLSAHAICFVFFSFLGK